MGLTLFPGMLTPTSPVVTADWCAKTCLDTQGPSSHSALIWVEVVALHRRLAGWLSLPDHYFVHPARLTLPILSWHCGHLNDMRDGLS
jgi:hypothetical protein